MGEKTVLHHVAIQFSDRNKAEIFFTKLLGLQKVKSFTVSENISEEIFGMAKSIDVDVYGDDEARFEVFITNNKRKPEFEHICIVIDDKSTFIKRCKKYGIEPVVIKKEGKDLLFVKDFSDNLYEVKER